MNKNDIRKLVKEELNKILEAPKTKAPTDIVALQKAEKTSAIAGKQAKINTPAEVVSMILSTIKRYMGQVPQGQRPMVKTRIFQALKKIK